MHLAVFDAAYVDVKGHNAGRRDNGARRRTGAAVVDAWSGSHNLKDS